ncbi:hypothetical protein K435DRAFT_839124 [Dendrothele bispora CBS 962.96]|uniref:DUF6534 domain-containing protein n=1 Tax=Dendrothele bispora (strain CBS 962.96) TaxID=1314807 RepID=A0A4S8M2B3_DENBC|nr:hypothetical protein K435DRAFT_839124 [Dendrothele bispora CBS 962.96]
MTGPSMNMDNTMGVAFIGVVIASFLLGIAWLQTFFYFTTYTNDPKHLRYAVLLAMFFDTAHQGLITHTMYTYLVTNYGNQAFLGECVWSLLAEVLFNGFSGFIVQCFLASRVWSLSKNIYLTVMVMSLIVAEFGCVVAFSIIGLVKIRTFQDLKQLQGLSISVNALAAIGDVLIAASLIALLHRSKTGFKRSDTMIDRLMLFAVHTGAVTTAFAIASLVSINVAPNTFIYIFFFFCMGRLYTNSLLATLNARQAIRNAGDNVLTTSNLSFTKLFGKNNMTGSVDDKTRQTNISIKIDTTKEFISDGSIHDKSHCDFASPDSSPTRTLNKRDVDGGSSMMDDRSHFEEDYEMGVRRQRSNGWKTIVLIMSLLLVYVFLFL